MIVKILALILTHTSKLLLHYAQEVSKVIIQLADLLKWSLLQKEGVCDETQLNLIKCLTHIFSHRRSRDDSF